MPFRCEEVSIGDIIIFSEEYGVCFKEGKEYTILDVGRADGSVSLMCECNCREWYYSDGTSDSVFNCANLKPKDGPW